MIRYDPRDVAEIRVFHDDKFLCRAICQELAGEIIPLREIVRVRKNRRRELRAKIENRRRAADAFSPARCLTGREQVLLPPASKALGKPTTKLKRYADNT